ncbi:substrate-binding domain-containing protein [Thalassospira sp. MA62]|nr:substrate-binding domain-containing protein [Thalassospira sp. MA62]
MTQSGTGKKVTSRDVAEKAGVSRSAVSRSFTPGAYVSEKVRTRVLAAAQELGYLPNVLARGLIAGSSGLVALIIGPMTSPQDAPLIEDVTCKLGDMGKRTLLVPIPTNGIADDGLLQALSYQVEAVIVFAGTVGAAAAEHCTRIGTHLTLFGRYMPVPGTSCVIYDNPNAADAAARLLVRGGHKRIAYIGTRHRAFSDRERQDAARSVLAEHGLHFHAYAEGDYGHDSGYQAALAMLNGMEPPDAIFASNDGMAFGVLDAARSLGIKVPNDLAVVGIDNHPMGGWAAYRLTSWGASINALGAAIITATFDKESLPQDRSRVHMLRVPLALELRDSTRKPG